MHSSTIGNACRGCLPLLYVSQAFLAVGSEICRGGGGRKEAPMPSRQRTRGSGSSGGEGDDLAKHC